MFRADLSPSEIFEYGSFGGTYWRPIYSNVTKRYYSNVHKLYKSLKNIQDNVMILPYEKYDININKYKVKVGTTLEYWELKNWINPLHPYGWIHWYISYYEGNRCEDDKRQISRYNNIGKRFKKRLVNIILKKYHELVRNNIDNIEILVSLINDYSISPKIRQTLQHWGQKIALKDFEKL